MHYVHVDGAACIMYIVLWKLYGEENLFLLDKCLFLFFKYCLFFLCIFSGAEVRKNGIGTKNISFGEVFFPFFYKTGDISPQLRYLH